MLCLVEPLISGRDGKWLVRSRLLNWQVRSRSEIVKTSQKCFKLSSVY